MSEKLSQILNASNELNSFSKLPSFKPVVLKNEVNNKKEIEKIINQYNDLLNQLNIIDLFKKIKNSNLIGQIFYDENNIDGQTFYNYLMVDFKQNNNYFKISKNGNSYLFGIFDKTSDEYIKTFDNNVEVMDYLLTIQDGPNYQEKYIAFISENIEDDNITLDKDRIIENINKENNNLKSFNIEKDDIYDFLINTSAISSNLFYLNGIGTFYQENRKWKFVEFPEYEENLNNLNSFLKSILSAKKHHDTNYQNYDDIEDEYEKFKIKCDLFITEHKQKKQNNLSEEDFEISPSIFDFSTFIGGEEFHYQDEEMDIDEINMMMQNISLHNHFIDDNLDEQNIMLQQELNQHLYSQLESSYEHHVPVMDQSDLDAHLSMLEHIPQMDDTSNMEFDDVMLFLYQDYNPDILTLSQIDSQQDNITIEHFDFHQNQDTMIDKSQTMWEKLENKNISIEDFFHIAMKNNFKLKPIIKDHDENLYFIAKQYIFKSVSKHITLHFAIDDDKWYLFNNNHKGKGLPSFIQMMYRQIGIEPEEKHAEVFLNFIEKNENIIQQEKNRKQLMTNKTLELLSDKNSEFDIVNIETLINDFIKEQHYYLLNIDVIEEKSRGKNPAKKEATIFNKSYRFKDNQWYCIDTQEKGNGYEQLIEYIYKDSPLISKNPDIIAQKIKSLKHFIKNEVLPEHFLNKHEQNIDNNLNVDSVIVSSDNEMDNASLTQEIDYSDINDFSTDDNISQNQLNDELSANVLNEENTHEPLKTVENKLQNNHIKVIDDFHELAFTRMEKSLLNRSVLNSFSMKTFIQLCVHNKSPYFVEKTDKEDIFLFGKTKNKRFEININDYSDTEAFVKYISNLYKQLNYGNEVKRIEDILKPELLNLFKQKVQLELEKHQGNLISDKLNDVQNNQVLINDLTNNNEHNIVNEHSLTPTLTPEEQYEKMLGMDLSSLSLPLKSRLSDYFFDFNGEKINFNINRVLKQYIRLEKVLSDIDIKVNYNQNSSTFEITSPLLNIKAEQNEMFGQEKWQSLNDNVEGDSFIELIKYIASVYKIPLSPSKVNKAIAYEKELSFLNSYPMESVITKFGAVKQGANYKYGDLTLNIRKVSNYDKEMFNIWNLTDAKGIGTINLVRHLLAYQNGIVPSKDSINAPENSSICSFLVGKELIKNFYLDLNNLEKLTLLNHVEINNHEDEIKKRDKFNLLLPVPDKNSDMMYDYLVNERKINPDFIKEFNGYKLYQGNYDYGQVQLRNLEYGLNNEVTWYPVIVFSSNDDFAIVRGIAKEYSDHIKQNVPGSKNTNPYYLEPSKDYTHIDSKDDEHYHVACFEAAIDALSYRCMYPQSHCFTFAGINIDFIKDALIQSKDIIKDGKDFKVIYALDNINEDENGEIIDSASRKAYFNLINKMNEYCYTNFMEEFSHVSELSSTSLIHELCQLLIAKYDKIYPDDSNMHDFYSDKIHHIEVELINFNSIKEITSYSKELKDILGKFIFEMDYVNTKIFELKSPEHSNYGQFKDWNEMLQHVVHSKMENNPNKSLEEIHEMIIEEFSPQLMKTTVKKALKKANPSI